MIRHGIVNSNQYDGVCVEIRLFQWSVTRAERGRTLRHLQAGDLISITNSGNSRMRCLISADKLDFRDTHAYTRAHVRYTTVFEPRYNNHVSQSLCTEIRSQLTLLIEPTHPSQQLGDYWFLPVNRIHDCTIG